LNLNISTGTIFDRVALACGAVSAGIGSLGLVGWALGSRVLTGVRLDYIPMAPNTALLVILLGAALFFMIAWPGNRTIRIAIVGISSLSILIAGLTLIGIVTGIDLGIDYLLLTATGTVGSVPVGLMSPVTAICFLSGSAALLLLLLRKNGPGALPGMAVVLVAGVVIIGYWYGTPLLYGGTIIPVALPTAVALGILGVGLIAAAGPDSWPLSSVTGASTRARLLRGLLPVILIIVLFVSWINTVIVGHADSSVVLSSAITAILSLLVVYLVVTLVSRGIGDAIDRSEQDRKNAEEKLAFSNIILSTQQEVSIDGILVVDESGKIISFNRKFVEIWNISPEVIASHSDERALQSVLDKLADPEEFLARVRYLYGHKGEKSREEVVLADGRVLDRYSAPMAGSDGNYYGRVWYFRDITDTKRMEESLRQEKDLWRETFDSIPDLLAIIDTKHRVLQVNKAMADILQVSPDAAQGILCYQAVHGTPGAPDYCPHELLLKDGKTHTTDVFLPLLNGYYTLTTSPLFNPDGSVFGSVHLAHDITEKKRSEELLKRFNEELEEKVRERTDQLQVTNLDLEREVGEHARAEEQIRASLDEKVILLREIHHRVKNNLQIIISLLNLQSRYIGDEKVRQALRESQNRVMAMSHVHEKLFQSPDITKIDLDSYIRFLGDSLFAFYGMSGKGILLTTRIQDIHTGLDTAIPVGLIINELISNSLKHAFPDGMKGEISIEIQHQNAQLTVVYKDNGVGIPADFDWHNAESLGLRLVILLVEQQDGTIELGRSCGTVFTIVVKEQE
jgi:two-component sensor histidine kinase/PAS domain-containing protein